MQEVQRFYFGEVLERGTAAASSPESWDKFDWTAS